MRKSYVHQLIDCINEGLHASDYIDYIITNRNPTDMKGVIIGTKQNVDGTIKYKVEKDLYNEHSFNIYYNNEVYCYHICTSLPKKYLDSYQQRNIMNSTNDEKQIKTDLLEIVNEIQKWRHKLHVQKEQRRLKNQFLDRLT